ncbi:hypothetical protein RCL1_004327 [Eukaryota sp. TZLM3-RCL]
MHLFFENLVEPDFQFQQELEESSITDFSFLNTSFSIEQSEFGCIGSCIWPATNLIMSFLESNSSLLVDKIVWDIGSGVGILSICFALMNAKNVIATDIPYVLKWINHNIQINKKLPQLETIVPHALVWGDEASVSELMSRYSPDFVFASDCVYSEESIPDLLSTVRLVLVNNPSTRVIFGIKWRAKATISCFWETIKEMNFVTTKLLSDENGIDVLELMLVS